MRILAGMSIAAMAAVISGHGVILGASYQNDYIPSNWGDQPKHKRGKFKRNQRKKKNKK